MPPPNPQNSGPRRNPFLATPNCPFPQQLSPRALSRGNLRAETPSCQTPAEVRDWVTRGRCQSTHTAAYEAWFSLGEAASFSLQQGRAPAGRPGPRPGLGSHSLALCFCSLCSYPMAKFLPKSLSGALTLFSSASPRPPRSQPLSPQDALLVSTTDCSGVSDPQASSVTKVPRGQAAGLAKAPRFQPDWTDPASELLIQFQPTNIIKAHSGPGPGLGPGWIHAALPRPCGRRV